MLLVAWVIFIHDENESVKNRANSLDVAGATVSIRIYEA